MFSGARELLRIVFASLNDDCLAHKRCTEQNLVWLELSDHKDSEYENKFSSTSVNKTAVQNVWQYNILLPGALSEVGETVAHIWPQVVDIAALQEFFKNDRFLTGPLWHICGSHF